MKTRLGLILTELGISQKEFASVMNVTEKTINNWSTGGNITYSRSIALCSCLNVLRIKKIKRLKSRISYEDLLINNIIKAPKNEI